MTRLVIMLCAVMLASACSYMPKLGNILPDKKNEYKKSESLPDLEVPPDLTADAINDSMAIPNEGASLSRYQQSRQRGSSAPAQTWSEPQSDEQWIAVRGNNRSIWPRLRGFLQEKGFSMELDDTELGVLETGWSEPFNEDGFSYREKFKIFSEPGSEPSLTRLFVSNERQVLAKREDGSDSWIAKGKDEDAEQKLAGDLNFYFNGSRDIAVTAAPDVADSATRNPAAARAKTLVQSTDDGKEFLAIPAEFTRAWRHTEIALERAGLPVAGKDQDRGIYSVMYYDPRAGEKKEGFFSKLKFWGDDEPEGVPYQISLVGVGDKTELVILDADGEWATNNDAMQIMAIIQNHLNQN